ncbi:MAG: DNA repair protein RecN, partial [Clostridia bacterium]|nr:DNA repair protein RecN [Clostridia bacterium]
SAEIERLTDEREKARIGLYNAAVKLSKARHAAAEKFEKEICDQLADLAMKSSFAVQFGVLPEIDDMDDAIGADGMDQVEFLISPNPGEPLRPLSRIASGGEMSRFMLALKNIIARLDNIETLVFDEIDTGISGRVAHTVAQKLYNISKLKQVIAITHLPQLAAFGDHHYLISKATQEGKTRTALLLLEGEAKVDEVARLAGSQTEAGKAHAVELIATADQYKSQA